MQIFLHPSEVFFKISRPDFDIVFLRQKIQEIKYFFYKTRTKNTKKIKIWGFLNHRIRI